MPQIELDRAVAELLSLERVERCVLVVESGVELSTTDRQCALGKQRAEAAAAAPERADCLIEDIRNATARGAERKRRKLSPHLAVEALDDGNDGIIRVVDERLEV